MLVRKRKENLLKKKGIAEGSDSEENLQTLRSWIRKIEQTTSSVSSRLSAVEKRLSGGMSEPDARNRIGMEGPVETLFTNVKKKNAGQLVRVLDSELALLHNEAAAQQQETCCLKEQLEVIEKRSTTMVAELQTVQASLSEIKTARELQVNRTERSEPFVVHLGALEFPVEFTGIIGGLLAFVIAILVLVDQKAVLLSPVFLFLVGLLLIGFALVKMVRSRSKAPLSPIFSLPLKTSSAHIDPVPCDRKEG
ncbi:MAG TPA: hypothetical protein DSN98_09275 [Thermoplasmata archaeon]|nr:MAG TPA: hypothetical protein DSN98_09275 [Thermoplasmata archaeon]